jgi:DNA-binding transcriptional LysR family regulator
VVLFNRSTRRVELTAAGERFEVRVGEILQLTDAAIDEVRRVDSGQEGTIRMGFIGSATYELMPALSRSLQADLPLLNVELKGELLSPQVEAALIERRLDLGVLRPFAAPDGIVMRTLRSEPLVAAVPVDHPAAALTMVGLAELSAESFVNYARGASATADAVVAACRAAGFEPRVRMEVSETATLVSFIAAGVGVALVPAGVQSVRIPGVVYLPLRDRHPRIDLVAAWRSDGPTGVVEQALARLRALVATG